MKIKIILSLIIVALLLSGSVFAQRSDADILADLQRQIRLQPQLGSGVVIGVQSGVVTLTGTVTNLAQKQNIINIARRTVGVKNVVDRIRVVPAQRRADEDIAASVRQALAGNLSKQEIAAIIVRSQNGVVTLTGTLPSSYPKQVAGVLASWVPGVVDLRNEIIVQPPVPKTDLEILSMVNERFSKNPFIQAQNINVSVNGGIVVLTGVVDNYLASEQAEAVARFTPGVVDVRNLLFVRAMGR